MDEARDGQYQIGLGVALPSPSFVLEGEMSGLHYTLDVALLAGRYQCTRLQAWPGADHSRQSVGVTAEMLRELPIARLVAEAAKSSEVEDEIREAGRRLLAEGDTRPTAGVLEAVSAAYRYGYAIGLAPTRQVMDLLGLTRSQANRWIAFARELGLLDSTTERRAGGVAAAAAQTELNSARIAVGGAVRALQGVQDELKQLSPPPRDDIYRLSLIDPDATKAERDRLERQEMTFRRELAAAEAQAQAAEVRFRAVLEAGEEGT